MTVADGMNLKFTVLFLKFDKKIDATGIWLRAYFDRHFGPVTLPLELKH